jgi:Leucyl-tRNA synthetase
MNRWNRVNAGDVARKFTKKYCPNGFLVTTDYADDLLNYCEKLPGWPDKVLTMQKNWIGKSYGAEIHFPLENQDAHITVFTTRQVTVSLQTMPWVNKRVKGSLYFDFSLLSLNIQSSNLIDMIVTMKYDTLLLLNL